jgi:single-stranded DNA-binding protein
MQKFLV